MDKSARLLAAAVTLLTLFSLPLALAQSPIQYHYDQVGRLVGVTDALGHAAVYTYDPVGNILSVTRHAPAQIVIINVAPGTGAAGDTVTLTGGGFSATASENAVSFNGASATVVSSTPSQIVAIVPQDASTGPIAVLAPAGGAASATPFVVQAAQAPSITGFTPSMGGVGTAVAVTGAHYALNPGANKLSFNGRVASSQADNSNSLATTVPPATSSGKIVVATAHGLATSTADFFVVPAPYGAADIAVATRMVAGQSKSVAMSAPGKKGLVLFDGTAGQRMSLSLSGVTIASGTVAIIGPNGVSIVSTSLASSGRFIDAFTLTASGTYTILINPSAASQGNVTLALNQVQHTTGNISVGGAAATVTAAVPGQNAELKFSGAAGQRVSLNMSGVSATLGCPALSIVKPDGAVLLAFSNYTCSTSYFFDALTLPLAGVYTIVIDPVKASTGSASFTLFGIPPETSAMLSAGGPAATLTTSVPGENASLIFSATAGQRISLNITGFSASLNCPSFSVLKPDGSKLVAPDMTCGASYFIDATALPLDGDYKIVMDPRLMTTGSATFALFLVPPDVAAGVSAGGPTVKLTTSVPGQDGSLSFSANAGQKISLNVTAISAAMGCVKLTIVKPDGGNLLAPATACGASYFIDATALTLAGTHTVLMNPTTAGVGSATFALYNVPDAGGAIVVGAPAMPVTITVPGQNMDLGFSGNAGQKITVRVTGNAVGCSAFSVRRPDGSVQVSTTSCNATVNLAQQTLATSGNYVLRIDPTAAKTGSVNVAITSP
jgi:YD repeat-containing protein